MSSQDPSERLEQVTIQYSLTTNQVTFVCAAVGDSMLDGLWELAERALQLSDAIQWSYVQILQSLKEPGDRIAFLQETHKPRNEAQVRLYHQMTRDISDAHARLVLHEVIWTLKSSAALVGIYAASPPELQVGDDRRTYLVVNPLSFQQRLTLLLDLNRINADDILRRRKNLEGRSARERVTLIARWANEQDREEDSLAPESTLSSTLTSRDVSTAGQKIKKGVLNGMPRAEYQSIFGPKGLLEIALGRELGLGLKSAGPSRNRSDR